MNDKRKIMTLAKAVRKLQSCAQGHDVITNSDKHDIDAIIEAMPDEEAVQPPLPAGVEEAFGILRRCNIRQYDSVNNNMVIEAEVAIRTALEAKDARITELENDWIGAINNGKNLYKKVKELEAKLFTDAYEAELAKREPVPKAVIELLRRGKLEQIFYGDALVTLNTWLDTHKEGE